MMSHPVDFTDTVFDKIPGDWMHLQAMRDFRRTAFGDTSNLKCDYLIFDLIEERFELIRYKDSLLTFSDALASHPKFPEPIADCGRLPRTKITPSTFDQTSEDFSRRVTDAVNAWTIVFNRVTYAEQFREDGGLWRFEAPAVAAPNTMLRRNHEIVSRALLPDYEIEVTDDAKITNPNHHWGFHPLHFE